MLARAVPRSIPRCCRAASSTPKAQSAVRRSIGNNAATASYQFRAQQKQQQLYRSLFVIAFAGGVATLSQYHINNGQLIGSSHAEAPPQQEENPLVFEKSKKQAGVSKEENRDLISSQHHQVKRSWEAPGAYFWGSNSGRVVAPDLPEETNIKTPRRFSWFDGKLLRDVKLDRYFGAAIDEKGDLLQWGTGYKPGCGGPETTLKGKNLISLSISRDRILGLARDGKVYSVPVSSEDQQVGSKPSEASWLPFWTWRSPIAYRTLLPKDLTWGEKVKSIDGGLEHSILLTNKGRVFSCASASDAFPSRGQLGVPGLTWITRPEGDFDQPHEIVTLKGFNVTQVACGDYHSLVLDEGGRVFSWGDNQHGQLGFAFNPESTVVDTPSLLPTQKLYMGQSQVPAITSIAAGGNNSFMTIDAMKVGSLNTEDPRANRGLGTITADTFAFGNGIYGGLANNRWTHVQSTPTKIPNLSGLFEYDERVNKTSPIRLAHISVGSTHASAVMKNITYLGASNATSTDDTNWGADIVFWGGNEYFQLGTGKRNNVSTPVYIQPLDIEAENQRAKKSSGMKEQHRFHITPRTTAKLGDGRKMSVEQRVECGRNVTCVYSGT